MDERLLELAQAQGGLVTRRQVLDVGLDDRALGLLVGNGSLERIKPGRFRIQASDTWVEQVRAAQLLAGQSSVAARGSAARLHQIEGTPTADVLTFYIPPSERAVRRTGLAVLRCQLEADEITQCADIACTSPLRTVVDCARFLPHRNAVGVIEGGVRSGLVRLEDITVAIGALSRVEGAPAARRALSRIDPLSQSFLETEARLLLLDAGIGVESQVELGSWHADLGVPDARLAIELQGGTHRSKEQHQEDETKRAAFLTSDWEIVGFTADDVRKRPGYVVAVVRRLVASRWQASE